MNQPNQEDDVKLDHQFIARQAIFDKDKNIYAYELLYRDSEANFFPQHISDEQATGRMFFDALLLHGIDKLTNNYRAFINLSTSALVSELPNLVQPKQVVIEIVERVNEIEQVTNFVEQMRTKGYVFALDDYNSEYKWEPLLSKVGYIKLEVKSPLSETLKEVQKLKNIYPETKIIVERIEDHQTFHQLVEGGVDLFQGYFIAKPEMMELKNISPIKVLVIDLMKSVLNQPIDFEQVQLRVSKDISLTARVLKMANGICKSAKVKISTISQAVIYLGEDVIRQFIMVLVLSELGSDKPSELTKLGLTRAKFISEMLTFIEHDKELINTGYLVGLVSVLDAILNKTVEEICHEFTLSHVCEGALLNFNGPIGHMLALVKAIELEDYVKFEALSSSNMLQADFIGKSYISALLYADETLSFV